MGLGVSCLPDPLQPSVKLRPVLLDHARCYYKINKKGLTSERTNNSPVLLKLCSNLHGLPAPNVTINSPI